MNEMIREDLGRNPSFGKQYFVAQKWGLDMDFANKCGFDYPDGEKRGEGEDWCELGCQKKLEECDCPF